MYTWILWSLKVLIRYKETARKDNVTYVRDAKYISFLLQLPMSYDLPQVHHFQLSIYVYIKFNNDMCRGGSVFRHFAGQLSASYINIKCFHVKLSHLGDGIPISLETFQAHHSISNILKYLFQRTTYSHYCADRVRERLDASESSRRSRDRLYCGMTMEIR